MNEQPNNNLGSRGWLERLSKVLLGEPKDREQLVDLLRNAQQRDLLDVDALSMIEGVLQVSELRVRDIMIPRSQMTVVSYDATIQEMLPIIIESAHSRFPVIEENKDEVAGILLAKDLLRYFAEDNADEFELADILRPAVMIPESKRLNVLLKEFRGSRNHMAVVVDEYAGVAGLVTIEDVLEQIVGDIEDEHDLDDDHFISRHAGNRFSVKALTPVDEFNSHFQTQYSDEEFDTIGGMVLSKLGYLPRRGESITIDAFEFKIIRADNRRIYLMELQLNADQISALQD